MVRLNELIIDGVKTSSFTCDVLVETRPKVMVSASKTALLEHNGISGAIVQSNRHRGLIEKSYHIALIDPSQEDIYRFTALLAREKFWLENEQEPTVRLWCYKVNSYELGKDEFGAWVVDVTFICHPTKFFKESNTQVVNASGAVLRDTQTVWFDVSQNQPGEQRVYVKYSKYADGREMSDNPAMYVGVATSMEATAPARPSSYRWQRLQGGDMQVVWANSADGRLDYTTVGTNAQSRVVAKARPRFEARENSREAIMDIWQTRQAVRLKPNTTYTLTARGCSKLYVENAMDYRAYLFMDFGYKSPVTASLQFKNNNYDVKSVTFTTPNSLSPNQTLMLRAQGREEDADWTGLSLDWYVLTEGNQARQDYPTNEAAQFMKYRYMGFMTTSTRPAGGSGVIWPQGSALAYPKITIVGESASETSFTVGDQVIRIEKLSESLVMINNPEYPSFLTARGQPVKWSGDFITVDTSRGQPVGVVLGPGIRSLTFETVWGWA